MAAVTVFACSHVFNNFGSLLADLQVESQALITKLSEQDNPYAIIASWVGTALLSLLLLLVWWPSAGGTRALETVSLRFAVFECVYSVLIFIDCRTNPSGATELRHGMLRQKATGKMVR